MCALSQDAGDALLGNRLPCTPTGWGHRLPGLGRRNETTASGFKQHGSCLGNPRPISRESSKNNDPTSSQNRRRIDMRSDLWSLRRSRRRIQRTIAPTTRDHNEEAASDRRTRRCPRPVSSRSSPLTVKAIPQQSNASRKRIEGKTLVVKRCVCLQNASVAGAHLKQSATLRRRHYS